MPEEKYEATKLDLDLSIDENDMAGEWQEQPTLMLEYSLLLADAQQEVDEYKARLSLVTAELETDIRNNPQDYEIAKVTEAAVAAAIPQQKSHQVATLKYNRAKHAARIYQAAVDALGHRKSALQGMTDLFMRQWFADPESREQAREAAKPVTTKTVTRRIPRRPAKD